MAQCTAPQLRRFIKSRPYVPMHELRRRFSIEGGDDDVTPVRMEPGWIYVGLPSHEGRLLGDLLRTGEIGYELSLDPANADRHRRLSDAPDRPQLTTPGFGPDDLLAETGRACRRGPTRPPLLLDHDGAGPDVDRAGGRPGLVVQHAA